MTAISDVLPLSGITSLSNQFNGHFAIITVLPLSGITSLSNSCGYDCLWDPSFTTIWNYITLKLLPYSFLDDDGFTTIWNYITLKL